MKLQTLWILGILGLVTAAPGFSLGIAEAGAEKVVYSEGFETDFGGFVTRGPNEVLSLDGIPPHSGNYALTVSHRTSTWNGPMKDLSKIFHKGRTYRITVWARYDVGPDFAAVNMSFAKTVAGAGDVFENVGSGQLVRGVWTKIEAEYSVPKDANVTVWKLYFETPYKSDSAAKPADLITFAIDDLTITRIAPVPKVASKDLPAFKSFFPADMHIGTAVTTRDLDAADGHSGLLRHFNTLVLGNEMKQDATEPQEGLFRFSAADAFVKYAQDNGYAVRGHTLLWHQQVPAWLFKDPDDPSKPASKEVLLARIEKHIKTLVGRYKGQVFAWDVVNECIGETDGQLRASPYLKIVGSDEFIEKAFRWAHEADPNAKLVLNDYNTEYPGPKQEGFYREVKSLLDRGVPITSVGFQTHISVGRPSVSDMKAAIERFAALGLDVQVTELDVSIYASGSELRKTATREILSDQATRYAQLFQMYRDEHAAGHLSTVLIWGMSDDETWLNDFPTPGRSDAPLLFDRNLQPKPAYWAVVDPSKMPILIQRADVFQAAQAPTSATDPAWDWATTHVIKDAHGAPKGWFRVVWTSQGLTVLARVQQPSTLPDDAVTFYLDPSNSKAKSLPQDALKVTVPRSKAVASDPDGYTVVASLATPAEAKTMEKFGFDVKFQSGTQAVAWNDTSFKQEVSEENWGTLTLKPQPVVASVAKGTPKLDGIDPRWASVPAIPLAVVSQGTAAPGSTVKLLWDEGHLYALYDVRHDGDPNDRSADPWNQDSVELFLDLTNSKAKTYDAGDGQYRVNFRNVPSFNGGRKDGFQSFAQVVPGGYQVVMAAPLYLAPGAAGTLLGFDAQLNYADSSATRVGIRNWADGSNQGYQDASGWGVIKLVP